MYYFVWNDLAIIKEEEKKRKRKKNENCLQIYVYEKKVISSA